MPEGGAQTRSLDPSGHHAGIQIDTNQRARKAATIIRIAGAQQRIGIRGLLARRVTQIQILNDPLSGLIGIGWTMGGEQVDHIVQSVETLERSLRGLLQQMIQVRSGALDVDRQSASDVQRDRQRIAGLGPHDAAGENFMTQPAVHEMFELIQRDPGLRYLDSHHSRLAGADLLAEVQ